MELYWHDSLEWLYPDQLKENALKTKTPVLDVPRGGIASIVLVVDQVPAETEIVIAPIRRDVSSLRWWMSVSI